MYTLKTLSLYLTHHCQLKCKYCIFGSEKKEHMPTNYAIKRINEAHELGVPHVVFVGGEPTLHPDFLKIFREVKKLGMSVLMVTNGISIKKEIFDEFTDYLHSSYYLSLDCIDEETNDYYRDKNSFKFVIETINKIRQKDPSKFIGINSILVKETLEHIEETAKFLLEDLKVNSLNVERVIPSGSSKRLNDNILIKDISYYFSKIDPLIKKYPGKFKSYTINLNQCLLDCKNNFNLLVFPNKKIYLCCNLPNEMMQIGDENTEFKELIKGEQIQKVVNKIHSKLFKNSSKIRKQKNIFGCVECVEEYNRLNSDQEENLIVQAPGSL